MAYVDYEQHGRIVVIRMNRPERMNAMGRELLSDLAAAWTRYQGDADAFVAIFTGTGRAFCVGLDIKEAAEIDAERLVPVWELIDVRDPYRDGTLTKPTIAAVNGYALGGGFGFATRADICVAAESAVFEITEVHRGGPYGWSTGFHAGLPRAIATELAFGGRMTAKRAYDVGLINDVVPDDQLMERAMVWAERLLDIPPLVLRANRELVNSLTPQVPQATRILSEKYLAEVRQTRDAVEAMTAFKERRRPIYQDR
jgi:enoyl-CoA hydratase/carnithine racemase